MILHPCKFLLPLQEPEQVSSYDIDGQLALHWAAKNGYMDMVKYLVDIGPGFINFKNIRFRTPLHWAASYAGYDGYEACEEIAYYLVEHGADITIKNKDTMTPIKLAEKGPLGKKFADKLKEKAKGVEPVPLQIGIKRVFWG
jgi:ankyrin repeat protein